MLFMSSEDDYRRHPVPDIAGQLSLDAIKRHSAIISDLGDRRGLLSMLVPHIVLPEHDPAAFIMQHHVEAEDDADTELSYLLESGFSQDDVNSSYDLGVVFGRSLLQQALPEGRDLPPVSDLDESKKSVVETYLNRSKRLTIGRLDRNDNRANKYMAKALDLFIGRAELLVPDLMIEGNDELRRGFHDYLSVINLLEAKPEDQAEVLRRALGRFTLSSAWKSISGQ